MDAHEVMRLLKHIVRYPHDADDAVEALYGEWVRQSEKIAKLEEQNDLFVNVISDLYEDGE